MYRHLGSALVFTDYSIIGLIHVRDGIDPEALAGELRQLPGAQQVTIVPSGAASTESRETFLLHRNAGARRDQAWASAFIVSPHYPRNLDLAALDADAAEYAYEGMIAWPHVPNQGGRDQDAQQSHLRDRGWVPCEDLPGHWYAPQQGRVDLDDLIVSTNVALTLQQLVDRDLDSPAAAGQEEQP